MVVENVLCNVQQLENIFIANRIEHTAPGLPSHYNVADAEHSQLLGNVRLFNPKSFAQFIYALFAGPQRVYDSDANGVGQCLEELSLKNWEVAVACKYSIIRI